VSVEESTIWIKAITLGLVWKILLCHKKYGFNQGDSDHTLFFKRDHGKLTVLIIYVDDMIITGDNSEKIKKLEERLF
jgi:hypothetical protein